jgi:hypothetical protein
VNDTSHGDNSSYSGTQGGLGSGIVKTGAKDVSLVCAAGPQAACIGCVGFAAFSVVIDKVMGEH